ncbi:MAG: TlpA disulfide reductase family protein [Gammaproteobacteria bacterium]|nr:TlpA disulfide reductase family protein [Gammaproteobacteria bacterium]
MSNLTNPTRQSGVCAFALLLAFAAGCEMASDDGVTEDEANWRLVAAYIDLDTAWHRRDAEIGRSDDSAHEKERRRKEERGEHPDIVLAVVAARAIVDSGGERAFDAAKFLVEHPAGLSPTADSDIAFGNAALARLVGPDWSAVEAYHEAMQAWRDDNEARREAAKAEAEEPAPREGENRTAVMPAFVFIPPPEALRATAAAQAILDAGTEHDKARDAAEFLVEHGMRNPQALIKAARWLNANALDFEDWPEVLMRLASAASVGGARVFDDFLTEVASEADDPVVRATARYFAATALAQGVNEPSTASADREARREQALAMAVGMSAGIEDEEFVKKVTVDGEQVARTMGEAEAALVHGIRHTLVGSTVADEAAKRLDGTDDSLSAYADKVVLMDFWATWCGPCIAALPRMRDLADAHRGERFEILGISVDAELETVTDFMEDEPMPWAHWHVGVGSELGLSWNINAYPTYVVVDGTGVILSRGHDLDAAIEVIEGVLGDEPSTT